jgi:hypothetical protein
VGFVICCYGGDVNTRTWIWLGLLAIVALAGCRGSGGALEDVDVTLVVTPDPPRIGPANVVIKLIDAEGQPVTGADMSLEGNMNHAGMVPVLAQAREVSPGRYQAELEFTMGGDWLILVQATLPDGRSLEHQVDVPGVDAFCGTPSP